MEFCKHCSLTLDQAEIEDELKSFNLAKDDYYLEFFVEPGNERHMCLIVYAHWVVPFEVFKTYKDVSCLSIEINGKWLAVDEEYDLIFSNGFKLPVNSKGLVNCRWIINAE
jgi:hypothetical protein